jgi:hypothetical protein
MDDATPFAFVNSPADFSSRAWASSADGRAYMQLLRGDVCAYCFGPGGTVDHVDPRPVKQGPERRDPMNLTGACAACNRIKDKGKDGGHRSVLRMLEIRREQRYQQRRQDRSWLSVGAQVSGPFFDRGTVVSVEPLLIDVRGRAELWPCNNSAALKPTLS